MGKSYEVYCTPPWKILIQMTVKSKCAMRAPQNGMGGGGSPLGDGGCSPCTQEGRSSDGTRNPRGCRSSASPRRSSPWWVVRRCPATGSPERYGRALILWDVSDAIDTYLHLTQPHVFLNTLFICSADLERNYKWIGNSCNTLSFSSRNSTGVFMLAFQPCWKDLWNILSVKMQRAARSCFIYLSLVCSVWCDVSWNESGLSRAHILAKWLQLFPFCTNAAPVSSRQRPFTLWPLNNRVAFFPEPSQSAWSRKETCCLMTWCQVPSHH